jgi:uncharacterized protein YndB with AHSA1/START domain
MAGSLPDSIERSVFLRASPARVWRALITPAEFSAWFSVRMSGEMVEGARVDMVSTHPEHQGVEFYMIVHKLVPERLLSWRWPPADEGENGPMTTVELVLEPTAGGTQLTVTESGFSKISPALHGKVFAGNTEGWEIQMRAIEAYVARTA